MNLKCNFRTQKLKAILDFTDKSIISKMRAFNKIAKYIFEYLFVLPIKKEGRQHCLAIFDMSQT